MLLREGIRMTKKLLFAAVFATVLLLAGVAAAGSSGALTTPTLTAEDQGNDVCVVYAAGSWSTSTGSKSTVTVELSDGVRSVVSQTSSNGRTGAYVHGFGAATSSTHTFTATVTLSNKDGVLDTETVQADFGCVIPG